MDPWAAFMMLVAGLLHACWHAIVKVGNGLPILAGMGLVSAAVTLPVLLFVPVPSASVWPILLLSLALHAGYKVSLAQAYNSAEFSKAYPVARGLVPFLPPHCHTWCLASCRALRSSSALAQSSAVRLDLCSIGRLPRYARVRCSPLSQPAQWLGDIRLRMLGELVRGQAGYPLRHG
jgi:hypothetical protein